MPTDGAWTGWCDQPLNHVREYVEDDQEYQVEAPITDHLRDLAPYLEKYKVVQMFPV